MTDQGDSNAVTGQRPQRYRYRILLGAAAVALVITAVVSFRWGAGLLRDDPMTPRPTPSAEAPEQLTVAQIYETLAPSVVSIKAGGASGTGVLANADGAILTALHVVEGAQSIEVIFGDGTRSVATIAGADPSIDIAVLTAESLPSVVVPAVIGGSGSVGDEVVAIGNQLGLTQSTTAGVISGLGRSAARTDGDDIEGLIQFDAAVNPGSSGGPLVNTRGQTIGIVVALANPTEAGTFIGIGFAVPIGTAVGAGEGQLPQL